MGDQQLAAQIARIDERTKAMTEKLDEHLETQKDHAKRLKDLEDLKNMGKGAVAVLSLLWVLTGGLLVKHIVVDAQAVPEVHAHAR